MRSSPASPLRLSSKYLPRPPPFERDVPQPPRESLSWSRLPYRSLLSSSLRRSYERESGSSRGGGTHRSVCGRGGRRSGCVKGCGGGMVADDAEGAASYEGEERLCLRSGCSDSCDADPRKRMSRSDSRRRSLCSPSSARGLCLDASKRARSCCSRSVCSGPIVACEASATLEPRRSARVGMLLVLLLCLEEGGGGGGQVKSHY